MNSNFIGALFFLLLVQQTSGACSNGYTYVPVGTVDCVTLTEPHYDDAQWATCVSGTYIETKSLGRFICVDGADYCWAQCEMEEFNNENGQVHDTCKCISPKPEKESADDLLNELLKTTRYPKGKTDYDYLNDNEDYYDKEYNALFTIATWCLSPNGTECNWFQDCLNRKYPCASGFVGEGEQNEDEAALSYVEGFCQLPTNKKLAHITTRAQQWLDATRKCILVTLVPLMRPWQKHINCQIIHDKVLDAQISCYVTPDLNGMNVCSLSCRDWAQVFWAMKNSNIKAYTESMQAAVRVMQSCGHNWQLLSEECPLAFLNVNLTVAPSPDQKILSRHMNDIADDVTTEIARRLNWSTGTDMDWYGYVPNATMTTLTILLANTSALYSEDNLYQENKGILGLFKVINKFVRYLEDGSLYDIKVMHGERKASVMYLDACGDSGCEVVFLNATAGPRPPKAERQHASSAWYPTPSSFWIWILVSIWIGVNFYAK